MKEPDDFNLTFFDIIFVILLVLSILVNLD